MAHSAHLVSPEVHVPSFSAALAKFVLSFLALTTTMVLIGALAG
jgi:hypothetical protein